MIRLLLLLYPQAWRHRYGDELSAHLRGNRLRAVDVLDLLQGALDAHLHPQWPRPRQRLPIVAPSLLALIAAVTIQAIRFWFLVPSLEVMRRLGGGYWPLLVEDAAFVTFALMIGLLGRMVRQPLLAAFGLLFGARIAAEAGVGFVTSVGPLSTHPWRIAYPWPLASIELVLWSTVIAILLRHRLRLWVGFAVGAGLELLLVSQVSLVAAFYRPPLFDWLAAAFPYEYLHGYPTLINSLLFVPGYVGWIGLALWAAVVATLIVDGRHRVNRPPVPALGSTGAS